MPILDIKSTQEAIKNPTLAMVIEEGFKITDANNELISNAYDIVKNDATQSANSAKVAEQKANEANAHALASAESARQANISADNAITIATDAEATANGIDAKATEALTNSEQAQAGVIRLDGKTDATNDRVGKLEISDGQQEAKISTLQRDLNNVKAEYLDKYNLTETQLVRSLTDFEKSPLVPTIKSSDVDKDDGRRGVNYATMKRDAVMLNGDQIGTGEKTFGRLYTLNRFISDEFYQNANLFALCEIIADSSFLIPGVNYLHGSNVIIGAITYSGVNFGDTNITINGMFIGPGAFENSNVTTVTITNPNHTFINYNAFQNCRSLKSIKIKKLAGVGPAMSNCPLLSAFIIENICNNKIPELTNPAAFAGTPIQSGTGYIYVPDSTLERFKKATNWIVYANQIKPISELPPEGATV